MYTPEPPELSRNFEEIKNILENKVSYDDLELVIKDYVLHTDLLYMLEKKVDTEEILKLSDNKENL